MPRNPFSVQLPLWQRIAIAAGMGISGLVGGMVAMRQLELPWSVAIAVGVVGYVLLALVAWRSPELFVKNRP